MSLPKPDFRNYSTSTRTTQKAIKEPRTTSKQLQASLASVKVRVHGSIRKRLSKNKNHCRPKGTRKLVSRLTRSILMILKAFQRAFCLRGRVSCCNGCTITAFVGNSIMSTARHDGGGGVMVWGRLLLQALKTSLLSKAGSPDGDHQQFVASSCSTLGDAAAQRTKKHQRVHLWMASNRRRNNISGR